jgi:hypothetical protein
MRINPYSIPFRPVNAAVSPRYAGGSATAAPEPEDGDDDNRQPEDQQPASTTSAQGEPLFYFRPYPEADAQHPADPTENSQ